MLQEIRAFFSRVFTRSLPSLTLGALGRWQHAWHDGEKFPGGFGPTQLLTADYWTLRARSSQLFKTNLYARGLLRRLVTNVINTGLYLEAVPEESLLGIEEDGLVDWAENVENRWRIWTDDPWLCDHSENQTFGAIQAQGYLEALISGDVLVTLRQHRATGLPRVHLVNAAAVQTPIGAAPQRGNRIVHGVELDEVGRHVAFWVTQRDGTSKRLPAYGEKTGRKLAWLLYGTDKRLDEVRGEPLLALVLQSLKEIDRYRDSVQRKAVVNSMLAMFIKKTADKPGTRPMTAGGAVRRGTEAAVDTTGVERRFHVAEHIPGLVIDELQQGEEPHGFPSNGIDEKFGDFEEAIVAAIAWVMEIPPEILTLAFSNNYSASQAAINEFKIFLNRVRTLLGEQFCQPIYTEWLVSETLTQKIPAPGLLDAWRDSKLYDVFGAWVAAEWCGHIKPSTDVLKQAKGYEKAIEMGLITRDRAARELTGTKYSKNVKKLRTENAALVEALKPIRDAEAAALAAARPAPTAKPAPAGAATKRPMERLTA